MNTEQPPQVSTRFSPITRAALSTGGDAKSNFLSVIHDLLHARVAALAGAELILTRDGSFHSLGEKMKAEWP